MVLSSLDNVTSQEIEDIGSEIECGFSENSKRNRA